MNMSKLDLFCKVDNIMISDLTLVYTHIYLFIGFLWIVKFRIYYLLLFQPKYYFQKFKQLSLSKPCSKFSMQGNKL